MSLEHLHKVWIAYLVTECLEDSVADLGLSRRLVNSVYKAIDNHLDVPELRARNTLELKRAIKRRLHNGFYSQPIPFPEERSLASASVRLKPRILKPDFTKEHTP